MSLETVVEDIREEARDRAEKIRAETEAEVKDIIADAEREAEEIIAERKRQIQEQIEREREQAISSAKLAAKQELLGTRRDLIGDLRDAVEERIHDLDADQRAELTRPLLADAVAEFPDDASLEIRGSEQDAALLESLAEEYENADHAGSIECLGGVEVSVPASRVTFDNTFDAIIDRMWEEQLKHVSDRLFASESEQ